MGSRLYSTGSHAGARRCRSDGIPQPILTAGDPATRARSLTALLALLILCAVPLASAAGDDDDGDADLAIWELEQLLDLEVETASKKKQSMTEAPAFTHVITREQLLRYGYRNVSEAISSIIGFYSSTDLAYSYTGVRGFARSGDSNTRVLVLFDGQRMNDPIYDFGAVDDSLPIDIDGVARIEVVKGPGSALWGSNALLAVVNIVPETGVDIDGVESGVDYGSYKRFKAYAKGGKEFEGGIDMAAMYSHLKSAGDEDIVIPGLGNAEDQDGETAMKGYFTSSYKGFKLNFLAGTRDKQDPTGANYVIFNSPFDGTSYQDDRLHTQLSYEREVFPDRDANIVARFYHSIYNHHGDYEYDTLLQFPDVDPYINHDSGESQWWGTELQASGELHPRVELIGGFEYHDIYKAKLENVDSSGVHLDEELDWTILAGYLQSEIKVFESLRFTLGGRVDDYSNLSVKWSPRAAVVYTPLDGMALKALFGQAFRAPNAYERVYDNGGILGKRLCGRRGCRGAPRLSLIGNPDLDPETITTWELIWDQKLFRNFRLVTSLYRYDIDDIITPVELRPGVLQYQNLGKVESRGVETMLQMHLENGIIGHLGFSALRTEDAETGSRVENSPKYLGNLAVSIPLLSNRVFASTELRALGGRKTLGGGEVGASFDTNLVLRYIPFKWVDMTFGIYNLIGEDQQVPSALEHLNNDTDELPLRGRSFRGVIRGSY